MGHPQRVTQEPRSWPVSGLAFSYTTSGPGGLEGESPESGTLSAPSPPRPGPGSLRLRPVLGLASAKKPLGGEEEPWARRARDVAEEDQERRMNEGAESPVVSPGKPQWGRARPQIHRMRPPGSGVLRF